MDRLIANRAILAILAVEVERNPDLRFHQLLQYLGVETKCTDQFYEESEFTLNELDKRNAGI
jgi:hypothetical protein